MCLLSLRSQIFYSVLIKLKRRQFQRRAHVPHSTICACHRTYNKDDFVLLWNIYLSIYPPVSADQIDTTDCNVNVSCINVWILVDRKFTSCINWWFTINIGRWILMEQDHFLYYWYSSILDLSNGSERVWPPGGQSAQVLLLWSNFGAHQLGMLGGKFVGNVAKYGCINK